MKRTKKKRTIGNLNQQIIEKSAHLKIPVFILSAEDLMSIEILRHYHHHCKIMGYSQEYLTIINKTIRDFEKWQSKNRNKIKKLR